MHGIPLDVVQRYSPKICVNVLNSLPSNCHNVRKCAWFRKVILPGKLLTPYLKPTSVFQYTEYHFLLISFCDVSFAITIYQYNLRFPMASQTRACQFAYVMCVCAWI